jgi:nucleoside-diphosphate-sugar epimerase
MCGDSQPTNIGNPGEYTVRELAEMVVVLVGGPATVEYRDLPMDDPKVRQPDITRARAMLDWEPVVPLRDGLERTIAYFERLVR